MQKATHEPTLVGLVDKDGPHVCGEDKLAVRIIIGQHCHLRPDGRTRTQLALENNQMSASSVCLYFWVLESCLRISEGDLQFFFSTLCNLYV